MTTHTFCLRVTIGAPVQSTRACRPRCHPMLPDDVRALASVQGRLQRHRLRPVTKSFAAFSGTVKNTRGYPRQRNTDCFESGFVIAQARVSSLGSVPSLEPCAEFELVFRFRFSSAYPCTISPTCALLTKIIETWCFRTLACLTTGTDSHGEVNHFRRALPHRTRRTTQSGASIMFGAGDANGTPRCSCRSRPRSTVMRTPPNRRRSHEL